MNLSDHDETPGSRRLGPWQFRLRDVLLLPVVLAVGLGFFIALYPYSAIMLPVLFGTLALSLIPAPFAKVGVRRYFVKAILASFAIYIVMALLGPGYIDLGEVSRRTQCTNRLKMIGLALHNYHDRYGCFPPAYLADQNGRPMHSWRVLILPFLEREVLYRQYRFNEPWNGPNNAKLAGQYVGVYECPERAWGSKPKTNYVAVVGPGTAWPGATSTSFRAVRDGTANTVLVAEVDDSGIHWMEPRDLEFAQMPMEVNADPARGISSSHRDPGWRRRLLGANVLMVDGSVRFLPTDTPEDTLRALVTASGGESCDAKRATEYPH